jgi:hypothetical protein
VGEHSTKKVRGQSGTITAVVNALAKAGIELGENGSVFPKAKGASLAFPYLFRTSHRTLSRKALGYKAFRDIATESENIRRRRLL